MLRLDSVTNSFTQYVQILSLVFLGWLFDDTESQERETGFISATFPLKSGKEEKQKGGGNILR